MARKHLHELLEEDQEPFVLKSYIDDRRSQLKEGAVTKTSLQAQKRKPIVEVSTTSKRSSSSSSIYKQACFFSAQNSPDVRKSPFRDFPSPAATKSPSKTSNSVILHVPSRTAALLLEAAMRIQKQSSSSSRPKNQIKNLRLGLFGSILKRLSNKNRSRKCAIDQVYKARVPARKSAGKSERVQENLVREISLDMEFSCSCNNSRRNSTVWSDSNEGKSLDLETSSSRSVDSEYIRDRENGGFDFCENPFCSSPMSPFRFALQKCPSPGRRTPVFASPATSPSRRKMQEKENCKAESTQLIHLLEEEEEEEDKEQNSPVSVLDTPFEDDEDEEEDGYSLECSYAIVQRAKHQLLEKLRRFEKLAELDPIELEKRMLEEQDDEDESEYLEEEEEGFEDDESPSSFRETEIDEFVREVCSRPGFNLSKVSADMKRLVLDLIAEETREDEDSEETAKRVCERLDSWKEVPSNTIDMMVEVDFRREHDGWKRSDKEQVREAAMEIEVAIFRLLVEELSEELVSLADL